MKDTQQNESEKTVEEIESQSAIDTGPQGVTRSVDFPKWSDLAIFIGVYAFVYLIAQLVGSIVLRNSTADIGAINILVSLLLFIPVIAFTIIYGRKRGSGAMKLSFSFRKFNPHLVLWGVVLIVAAGVVIEPLLLTMPERWMARVYEGIGAGGWAILSAVILAPILEETLFRGLLLGAVSEKYGALRAVLISALIFGVVHIIPQQIINAFIAGIILGYIYFKSGSLLGVIFIHALNNAIAFVTMELFSNSKVDTVVYTYRQLISSDTFYYIFYGICLSLLVVGMVGIVKSLKKSDQIPDEVLVEENEAVQEQDDNNNES